MRDLELDAVSCKARIEELRDVIDRLEHPQRKRGRPRKLEAVVLPVQHAPGSIFRPDTDPDDDELPLQSDAPGA
jgi:hypothetical protein